jgi:hypothetical protein
MLLNHLNAELNPTCHLLVLLAHHILHVSRIRVKTYFTLRFILILLLNSLNAELNPIRHLLVLLGAHHILHFSRIRVKTYFTLRFIFTITKSASPFHSSGLSSVPFK